MAVIILVFIPENPQFYVQRDNQMTAKRNLKRVYSKVEGYGFEHEYQIILKEVEDGRMCQPARAEAKVTSLRHDL